MDKDKKGFATQLDMELYEQARATAKSKGLALATWVRILIMEAVEKEKGKN